MSRQASSDLYSQDLTIICWTNYEPSIEVNWLIFLVHRGPLVLYPGSHHRRRSVLCDNDSVQLMGTWCSLVNRGSRTINSMALCINKVFCVTLYPVKCTCS